MGEPLIYINSQKARDLNRDLTLQKYKKKSTPTIEKNLTSWMQAFFPPPATASSDPHFHIAILICTNPLSIFPFYVLHEFFESSFIIIKQVLVEHFKFIHDLAIILFLIIML